jgi:hypothetical protein
MTIFLPKSAVVMILSLKSMGYEKGKIILIFPFYYSSKNIGFINCIVRIQYLDRYSSIKPSKQLQAPY